MMKLYGYDTINTLKVLIFLLEAKVEFEFIPINIRAGDQRKPEFLAINPAGKVPVLFDGEQYQTESNAILLGLAQTFGYGLVDDAKMHSQMVAWLFYQASTLGPHFGQIEHWSLFAKTKNPEALARHRLIANQSIMYLDRHLSDKRFFCGDSYSIADIALFPWVHSHDRLGLSLENAGHLSNWLERIKSRRATNDALKFFGPASIFETK